MTAAPTVFLHRLPKAELHLHLEGTLAPATLVELRRRHGLAGADLATAEALYCYQDFAGFLLAFRDATEPLRDADDYELIADRMMEQLRADNVVHAEVFVSVGVCLWRNLDFAAIFEGLERARERGERDFGMSVLWIFDAVRHFGPEQARRVAELAVQFRERGVAGFGIGGDERRAPPELFREVYAYARDQGLHLTAHAGESSGPESIWGALNIGAERIGHGLAAVHDAELMETLAHRQVPVEVCLSSNVSTGSCPRIEDHPLRQYFEQGLMVTLNTDDPAMFRTSLSAEYALAQQTFAFTEEQLREIARNAFEASFLAPEKKLASLKMFDAAAPRP
jgi:adenosine deaminase/aminodeoxyfutalosine deaminase